MKQQFKIMLLVAVTAMTAITLQAKSPVQCPSGYYDKAIGKNQSSLLQALSGIIATHTTIAYDNLWDVYDDADVDANNHYIDIYSNYDKYTRGNKCGNYKTIGDCVNREHAMPKSWWGGTKNSAYSDAFHLYPTDGYINNQRSNFPYGECAGASDVKRITNGNYYGKAITGTSTFSGYSGKVFEPDDEYKGDVARSYFYMAAAYNSLLAKNKGEMLAENAYPVFTDWAINLLLKWHRLDPVSDKEINRNNYICAWQGNRNPFIDHPELAEYIWGDKKDQSWQGSEVTGSTLISPATGDKLDLGIAHVGKSLSKTLTIKGVNLTKALTVKVTGTGFSVSTTSVTATAANSGTSVTITFSSNTAREATGSLTVSSSEVGTVTVPLTAQAVSGIVALQATDITTSGFTARWENTDESTGYYKLHVLEPSGAEITGYPISILASTEQHAVKGLKPATAYNYYLESATDASFKSNTIAVTTAALIPVIDFQGDFEIKATVGGDSPIITAALYTENVTEDIDLDVTGNFEISLDKTNWSKELTIDADGESFYVRVADTSTAGDYAGTLSAATSTLDVDVDIHATVAAVGEINFVEGFESTTSWSGYATSGQNITGDMCKWHVAHAYLGNDATSDRPHGKNALRLYVNNGTPSIFMAEDKAGGAGEVSFYAAPFSSDADATFRLYYSVNGGTTWVEVADLGPAAVNKRARGTQRNVTISKSTALQRYAATLNVEGNVRIKIEMTSGKRADIDDITISDYTRPVVTALNGVATDARSWDAHAAAGAIVVEAAGSKVEIYNLDARKVAAARVKGAHAFALPAGIYLVVVNNQSKKVIVK